MESNSLIVIDKPRPIQLFPNRQFRCSRRSVKRGSRHSLRAETKCLDGHSVTTSNNMLHTCCRKAKLTRPVSLGFKLFLARKLLVSGLGFLFTTLCTQYPLRTLKVFKENFRARCVRHIIFKLIQYRKRLKCILKLVS